MMARRRPGGREAAGISREEVARQLGLWRIYFGTVAVGWPAG